MSQKTGEKKSFFSKVISVVSKIPKGQFLTYQQVAKYAGSPGAVRAVGNILAKNKRPDIPCHRVIKSNFCAGGFRGQKEDSWDKAAYLLKEGDIGVIPTDTIYGVVGSALNKKTVEKIYRLRKRGLQRPMIVLISSQSELKGFGIKLNAGQKKILKKFWPGKVSIILNCPSAKFSYLHRNTKTLAFRVPAKKEILELLKITGPLVAPSANWENYPPSTTIVNARKYFGDKVFYLDRGRIKSEPSSLIRIDGNKIERLRGRAKPLYNK
jgi:L-threonylcarbamoyladenylate synthase